VSGQSIDQDAPGYRHVILVPVEGQSGQRLRMGGGAGQIAGIHVDLRGHELTVAELEAAERADRDRAEQLEPTVHDPHRPGDIVVDEVREGQQVQGDAVQDSVAGLFGQLDDSSGVGECRDVGELRHRDRRPGER
jgi:hypothetical protein